jgi:hypothetical protein
MPGLDCVPWHDTEDEAIAFVTETAEAIVSGSTDTTFSDQGDFGIPASDAEAYRDRVVDAARRLLDADVL